MSVWLMLQWDICGSVANAEVGHYFSVVNAEVEHLCQCGEC